MSDIAIKIENLSKRYRLGLVGSGTLKDDLRGWWYRARGKDDPTLKIGEENRLDTQIGNYIWALKDINLEVKQGEVLGIIGKNGAGKSTLLKILSRVTGPTTGEIKTTGRIASLLEVGTGMHPELTGRENVFLNGAILGMTKAEIKRKFDEIVDFAGVARYIDTPVKRYSSGMNVRLGFAVAAFLEPEILIVDEVLAVGDAEFQNKAIGKMQSVSSNDGRTVLFVSHNMDSILKLSSRAIEISQGKLLRIGNTYEIIEKYLKNHEELRSHFKWHKTDDKIIELHEAWIHDENNDIKKAFKINEKIGVTFKYKVKINNIKYTHGLNIYSASGVHLLSTHNLNYLKFLEGDKIGEYKVTSWISENYFSEGVFLIDLAIFNPNPFKIINHTKQVLKFKIIDLGEVNSARGLYNGTMPGLVRPILNWNLQKV